MMSSLRIAFNLLSILLLAGLEVSAKKQNYDGYKIYQVIPQDDNQIQELLNLSTTNINLAFLNFVRAPNESVHVVVPPIEQSLFEENLDKISMKVKVINSDLARDIKSEQLPSPRIDFRSTKLTFNRYYSYTEMILYLDHLAEIYPKRVKVNTVGYSYGRRPIKTITISDGLPGDNKKVLFVEAGIHAREWIAPATALYVINQLVENFNENRDLLMNYDWVIIPSTNPDGYEYSRTFNRFWRKTRRPNLLCAFQDPNKLNSVLGGGDTPGMVYNKCDGKFHKFDKRLWGNTPKPHEFCNFGTDANRNFGSHWSEIGTSNNPCSDTYHGMSAFSEPESQTLRDVMHSLAGRAQMYLSLHSYGGYMLYPWGFTSDLPQNWRDIHEIARAGADEIERISGRKYRIGTPTNTLYSAAGISMDYALEKVGIPVALTIELPFGGTGFDPSPPEILSLTAETWPGIKAIGRKLQQKYP